jgi:uncharacterized protein (TIGR03905 family)
MKHLEYRTSGTCSQKIVIDVDDDHRISRVEFVGGCQGNTHGIASLVRGMKASEVKSRLKGILCGAKPTSCPDQLARALEEMGE